MRYRCDFRYRVERWPKRQRLKRQSELKPTTNRERRRNGAGSTIRVHASGLIRFLRFPDRLFLLAIEFFEYLRVGFSRLKSPRVVFYQMFLSYL